MIKKRSVLSLLFAGLLLSGCLGLTQPTDSDIEAMAKDKFNQEFRGLFLADTVIKDNGYKKNDTNYVAELTITGTAQRSLDEYAREVMRDSTLSHIDKMKQTFGIGVLKMTLPEFEQGDRIDFTRNYLFIKTDNGWMIKGTLEDKQSDSLI